MSEEQYETQMVKRFEYWLSRADEKDHLRGYPGSWCEIARDVDRLLAGGRLSFTKLGVDEVRYRQECRKMALADAKNRLALLREWVNRKHCYYYENLRDLCSICARARIAFSELGTSREELRDLVVRYATFVSNRAIEILRKGPEANDMYASLIGDIEHAVSEGFVDRSALNVSSDDERLFRIAYEKSRLAPDLVQLNHLHAEIIRDEGGCNLDLQFDYHRGIRSLKDALQYLLEEGFSAEDVGVPSDALAEHERRVAQFNARRALARLRQTDRGCADLYHHSVKSVLDAIECGHTSFEELGISEGDFCAVVRGCSLRAGRELLEKVRRGGENLFLYRKNLADEVSRGKITYDDLGTTEEGVDRIARSYALRLSRDFLAVIRWQHGTPDSHKLALLEDRSNVREIRFGLREVTLHGFRELIKQGGISFEELGSSEGEMYEFEKGQASGSLEYHWKRLRDAKDLGRFTFDYHTEEIEKLEKAYGFQSCAFEGEIEQLKALHYEAEARKVFSKIFCLNERGTFALLRELLSAIGKDLDQIGATKEVLRCLWLERRGAYLREELLLLELGMRLQRMDQSRLAVVSQQMDELGVTWEELGVTEDRARQLFLAHARARIEERLRRLRNKKRPLSNEVTAKAILEEAEGAGLPLEEFGTTEAELAPFLIKDGQDSSP